MYASTSIVTGNVASEVRLGNTNEGVPIATFRLAASERKFDRAANRWIDAGVTFYTIVCWRGLAENALASLSKGDPVIAFGRTAMREWERDGKTGVTIEVNADALGHDLSRGTTTFAKKPTSSVEQLQAA